MAQNRVFFPQEALDQWIDQSKIELMGSILVIKAEQRRYRVVEALHILAEVTGSEDQQELVGKVKSLAFLTELGAEILGNSMVIGDNAYEIVPGFLGAPLGSFAEHRAGHEAPSGEGAPRSDEALLAQYLLRTLE